MEIDDLKVELALLAQKFTELDLAIQEIRAFADQKFNHIEGYIENLELRISNLR
jgi:hypothetical protein